jgi:uncharacterized membrane protein
MIPRIGGVFAMVLATTGNQTLAILAFVIAACSAAVAFDLHRRVTKLEDRDDA